ncbi:hypothetical protein [Xanthobacter tagetidis]|uniref:Uncharacterized protein n=1 Tax=Xanthobacter tagetidis TaxID=60216 RepID=A0A3L7A9W9_9HYPH|nr:hypothetical protein [Xanthobacter tagetidis]MBB6306501.1 hypothetical protein [Xanthobacter tagetidis]RLP76192.1 hypothetical protein D9R14_15350 [Xanthobacter tagetidis]
MDDLARLLLRVLLVPLGYLSAVIAGSAVILVGEMRIGTLIDTARPDEAAAGMFVAIGTAVMVFVLLLSVMWMVAAVGILFSEAFAVRSWMFHAANGAVSAWIAAQLFQPSEGAPIIVEGPFYVVAAGLAAGLAYWLVAGSSAGFYKPILRSPAERAGRPALPHPAPPGALPRADGPPRGPEGGARP